MKQAAAAASASAGTRMNGRNSARNAARIAPNTRPGGRLGRRHRPIISSSAGVKKIASMSEIASPPPSVIASARKKSPVMSDTKISGMKTAITVRVEAMSGRLSSLSALPTASLVEAPVAWARWIASIMTIASSMNSPIPAAIPPSVIMLNDIPQSAITTSVIAIVQGTTTAATSALSILIVNIQTTATDNTSPSTIASRTLATDSATSAAWS